MEVYHDDHFDDPATQKTIGRVQPEGGRAGIRQTGVFKRDTGIHFVQNVRQPRATGFRALVSDSSSIQSRETDLNTRIGLDVLRLSEIK